MSHVFISYSKQNIDFARHLRKLLQDEGFAIWMDETQLIPSEQWWPTIEANIISCAAFIIIMSPESKTSSWVEREILIAEDAAHKKPIFPVLLQGKAWSRLADLQYEDMRVGLRAKLSPRLIQALESAGAKRYNFAPDTPPPLPGPLLQLSPEQIALLPRKRQNQRNNSYRLIAAFLLAGIFTAILAALIINAGLIPAGDRILTPSLQASDFATMTTPDNQLSEPLGFTATSIFIQTSQAQTGTPFNSTSSNPGSPVDIPSRQLTQAVTSPDLFIPSVSPTTIPTAQATPATSRLTNTPMPLAIVTSRQAVNIRNGPGLSYGLVDTLSPGTQVSVLEDSEDGRWIKIRLNNGRDGWVRADLMNIIGVPTMIPPTVDPSIAIIHNSDWKPQIRIFSGVEMVLVPIGCFTMGNATGLPNEKPTHQQCFDRPFWIDRYEVTNGQYGSSGFFSGDNRPREMVNWFEAQTFCSRRGRRLPNEREWEFAARGPDSLKYPWGDEFVSDYTVYGGNSNSMTASVGSKVRGVSWVGALDMSGNVAEWVSTIYDQDRFPYPYRSDDGRENLADDKSQRMQRGGGWEGKFSDIEGRSTTRLGIEPDTRLSFIGFRCARDYDG